MTSGYSKSELMQAYTEHMFNAVLGTADGVRYLENIPETELRVPHGATHLWKGYYVSAGEGNSATPYVYLFKFNGPIRIHSLKEMERHTQPHSTAYRAEKYIRHDEVMFHLSKRMPWYVRWFNNKAQIVEGKLFWFGGEWKMGGPRSLDLYVRFPGMDEPVYANSYADLKRIKALYPIRFE
ncbi:hypothetical protein KBC70_04460 [Candidatus Woesebacteria bacterium]|nr:hypothetical protein [Candidatus Woesebacteria bacterium]